MKTRLALLLGIRPDVIRAARLIALLDAAPEIELLFLWSGQHYSDNLKDVFFRQLQVRPPDIELDCRGETDGELVGQIITRLHEAFRRIRPDAALFLGDTNTVAGCLAAAQCNIPIVHIEGCMRSYDWTMPEEKYRSLIDHLSDVIYAYLPAYRENGLREGLAADRIVVTGNPIVDILQTYFLPRRECPPKDLFRHFGVEPDRFVLLTTHRRENVTVGERLRRLVGFCAQSPLPVLFPAGYLTQRMLATEGIALPGNILQKDPIGYWEFLHLLCASRYVMTDSGTVVEEACILGKPSVQMRWSTERPEVYDVGASVRFDPRDPANDEPAACQAAHRQAEELVGRSWVQPFGDGRASERIAADLVARATRPGGFRTHQPDPQAPHVRRACRGESVPRTSPVS